MATNRTRHLIATALLLAGAAVVSGQPAPGGQATPAAGPPDLALLRPLSTQS